MLQLEVPSWISVAAAQAARLSGKLVLFNPAPIKPFSSDIYNFVDSITPNAVEAEALTERKIQDVGSAESAAMQLLRPEMRGVIITLGELGACYADHDSVGYVPGFSVNAVDTVGAGDAFNAALAVALESGKPIEQAMIRANGAGALAVTKRGAQEAMPSLEELEVFLSSNT